MNERFTPAFEQPNSVPTELHTAYPAPERERPDWRRLEVTARRFRDRIAEGLAQAAEQHTSIERGTARCIAHVLSRALGRESTLAAFARTGEGDYEELREEYLTLYHYANTAWVTDLIDHFGVHLIRAAFPHAKTISALNADEAKLGRLLVPTAMEIGDMRVVVHIPGTYGATSITELSETLTELQIDKDPALRAFLSLPDVNAMSGDIMQDFDDNYIGPYRSIDDAIHKLSGVDDRIDEVNEYAEERCIVIDQLRPDYGALSEQVSSGFDVVEEAGIAYAFYK